MTGGLVDSILTPGRTQSDDLTAGKFITNTQHCRLVTRVMMWRHDYSTLATEILQIGSKNDQWQVGRMTQHWHLTNDTLQIGDMSDQRNRMTGWLNTGTWHLAHDALQIGNKWPEWLDDSTLTPDTWHMAPDTWHLTPDTWNVTCGGGWTFSQNVISLALAV